LALEPFSVVFNEKIDNRLRALPPPRSCSTKQPLNEKAGGHIFLLIDSKGGSVRAKDAQRTPCQSHISPSILQYTKIKQKQHSILRVGFALWCSYAESTIPTSPPEKYHSGEVPFLISTLHTFKCPLSFLMSNTLGGGAHDKEMSRCHLPRVVYHQVFFVY